MLLLAAAASVAEAATPQRLSDWLLAQPVSANAYPLGLSWRVPGETPAQNALRLSLLNSLSGRDREVTADPVAVEKMREWLHALPVTGRVPVSVPDARWLQANPARDPVLLPGQSVVLPQRPRTVTVITEKGERCTVIHTAGQEARAYLQACSPAAAGRADWVWIAQPDGRVQRFGVATWNREKQDEPAPGAWIWGPPRDGGWPARFSEKLIMFLATQGPAPDVPEDLAASRPPASVTPPGGASEGLRFSDLTGNKASPLPNPPPKGREGIMGEALPQGGEGIIGGTSSSVSGGEGIPRSPSREPRSTNREPRTTINESRSTNYEPRVTNHSSQYLPFNTRKTGALDGYDQRITSHEQRTTSNEPRTTSRSLEVTASDWGSIGLLQTPTARMRPAGDFAFHLSRTLPYTHGNVFVQPLDWLEAGFRYTSVGNRQYGPPELSGGQSYKDKSFDVKARLWNESAYLPQIAIGIRDVAGTGLFSGEYLVASKRTGDVDWSLGLGWGYLAGHSRKIDFGSGGNFSFSTYFTGRAAPFGGAQYQTPWEKLILKAEYDSNKFQDEPQANNQRLNSPWNFGLVYRAARSVDFTLGLERGNTVMLGLSLHTPLNALSTPKPNDPPRVPVAATRPQQAPDWSLTSSEIKRQTDWNVGSIGQSGHELRVTIDDAETPYYWRDRVDRVAAVLHRDAPQPVDRFTLKYREHGVDVAEHVIDRDAWLAEQTQPVPLHDRSAPVIARAPGQDAPGTSLYSSKLPRFETGLRFGLQQTLGGPDAFLLYQIYAEQQAKLRLRDDTWIQGGLRVGLIDNYDKFKFTAPSNLPRVRTYLREYLTTSVVTLPNLQITHVGKFSPNQYYSVYGGYLEEMFGGVGAEWLYRPFASRLALGVDINAVKQRDFRQDFGFDNAGNQTGYRTTTGHATLYWDTGWRNVKAKVSAGRYLAGDKGATVEVLRTFKNGVAVGAYMTKTDVSGAQFGEGSFDKGVYVSIPFDTMLTRSSNTVGYFVWKPLTRDGGAKLARNVQLYDMTRVRDDRALEFAPAPPPNDASIPSDRREAWTPPPAGLEPYTRVTPKPAAEQWAAGDSPDQRLIEALYHQDFRNIRTAFDGSHRLTVTLSNDQIRPISRAVGRAARTALRLAPLDTREIRIVYAQRADPVVTYDFLDLARLQRYFNGELKQSELADYVAVDYRNPAAREYDPLARLDDVSTEASTAVLANLAPETFSPGRILDDLSGAARTAKDTNWLRAGAIGTGLVLASSLLDRRADQFAKDHEASRWSKAGVKVGNALPWLGFAGATLAALDSSDPRRSRTGYAATEAGATAVLAVAGLKYAFGRARPGTGDGNHSFKPFSTASGYDGFPSGHVAVAWAVATPFAMEYDAPWLYGVAALTNLARVGGREHWLSDTVGGSLIGYGIGRIFWQSSRSAAKGEPLVWVDPGGVRVSWKY